MTDIPSKLLPSLNDAIDIEYWERDGWWVTLVVELFDFIEERGYRIARVQFHQEGSFIRYEGAKGQVVFHYDPDSSGDFGVMIGLRGAPIRDIRSMLGSLDRTVTPRISLSDSQGIEANLRYWARELRLRAPELL